jgi:hypothetical protein
LRPSTPGESEKFHGFKVNGLVTAARPAAAARRKPRISATTNRSDSSPSCFGHTLKIFARPCLAGDRATPVEAAPARS